MQILVISCSSKSILAFMILEIDFQFDQFCFLKKSEVCSLAEANLMYIKNISN